MRVTGTLNPAATVNLTAGTLDFGDGAVLNKDFVHNIAANNGVIRISAGHAGTNDLTGTGSFTLGNGRELVGSVNQAAAAPATPFVNTISTPITIEPTGGTLTVDREGPTVNQQGLVNFADVRLTPGSTLTMRRISENSVANITLLGNATIAGNNTNNQTRVGSVTGAGNTLTMGGTQNMQMVGPVIANIGVVATNSATVQLNSTTFGSYTSAFALNGNTYEQRGTRAANVSGGALPGLTGSGATTISANPGQGTFLGTGGALAINATAPDATVIARGIRLTGGGTAGATNVVGNLFIDTSAELEMTAANSLNFTNVTMAPHSGLVIGPNTNTAGQGLGLTSFVRFINNPPTVTNGMVAPNIIRKTSGGNEGFFLTYNTTSGFTTATPTVTVVNPAAGGATMPAATLATDIVVVDGADTDAAPNVVTVPMVSSELTFWALKTDQSITGFGTRLNIGSGGIIFSQGNNQNRTIEPDINFGSAEAFIAGREGGGDFVTGTLNNKNRDTLAGSVSGTGGFTKFAGGDLHLSGFNTFTGPVTIQRGRLVVDTGNGIGTGNPSQGGDDRNNPLTINANSSSNNGNNNHHPSVFDLGGNQQSVDGVYGNGGVQSSNFGAPFIIDKTSANGGTATFTGAITGSIQVFKRGTGTQIFAPGTYGDNTYDSGTTIEAGTLLVNNTSGSGTGSGAVFVNSGATLGGNGSIAGPLSVDPGAHLAPGAGPGKVGTLTLQQLSISGGILDYDGDSSGVDRINIGTDGFGASGTSTINVTPAGLGSGDYIIIDYSNGNPDISNFTLGPAPSGYTFSLLHDIDNTSFVLHVVSSGPPQWNLDANGSWGVAANWIGGIPNAPGATANFLGKITAPRTVTLDGDKTVGTINFDNANKYTIAQGSGGTLIINGSAINVAANRIAEISAPISITTDTNITAASGGTLILSGAMSIAAGKSATKLGPGTLTLSGAQNHGAGTRLAINSGRADLNANLGAAATGATASVHRTSLDLSVTSGDASAVAGADQNLAELTIGTPNAGLQGFDLNTPAAAGQFRSVHVYAANLTTAKAALYAAIKNATTSSGDGIYDSGMAAHGSATRLGLAQVPDAFGEANIFIRPTRVGDLNLDGNVSISDFIDLASHFGGTGTWQEGDLNYDNAVSISDFIDLASNFGSSYAGGATPMSPDDQQRAPNGEILPLGTPLSSFAQSVGVDPAVIGSAVPEPSTLGIAAIGSLGLLARRRTRSAEGRQGGNPPKGAQGSNKGGGMTRG
jgi:autotransporter-associated beta strand protein